MNKGIVLPCMSIGIDNIVPLPSAARGNAVAIKSSQILSAIGRPVSLQQGVQSHNGNGHQHIVSSVFCSLPRFRLRYQLRTGERVRSFENRKAENGMTRVSSTVCLRKCLAKCLVPIILNHTRESELGRSLDDGGQRVSFAFLTAFVHRYTSEKQASCSC